MFVTVTLKLQTRCEIAWRVNIITSREAAITKGGKNTSKGMPDGFLGA